MCAPSLETIGVSKSFASVADSDRVLVMSGDKVAYLTEADGADRTTVGRYMAGHRRHPDRKRRISGWTRLLASFKLAPS